MKLQRKGPEVKRRTAIIYDSVFLEHDTGAHPERPGRLISILDALKESGLESQVPMVRPREATIEQVELVHDSMYIRQVERTAEAGGGWLDADTVMSSSSYKAALMASGAAIQAVDLLVGGKPITAFALVRPPGHHALPARAMGFCLLNNVAIAAHYALQQYGLERVLIVDYDVHHGNGTQDIFYRDGRVLYFSTHQYPWYPGTGRYDEIGYGDGEGATVNVPFPSRVGDSGYLRAFEEVLLPIARRFSPQLVLVSAGYDAHWADSISLIELSTAGYARLAEMVISIADELCQGRIAFLLEGGYHLKALSSSVTAALEVLLGQQPEDPLGPSPNRSLEPDISRLLAEIKRIHRL